MSRSVGLREDQREGEVLATLILRWLPDEPRWCYREQAHSYNKSDEPVGAHLLAKRPELSAKI